MLFRSVSKRGKEVYKLLFQFIYAVRYSDDGAATVDEEEGTISGAVLFEHAIFVVNVNEARPREGVTLNGLAHGIGGRTNRSF